MVSKSRVSSKGSGVRVCVRSRLGTKDDPYIPFKLKTNQGDTFAKIISGKNKKKDKKQLSERNVSFNCLQKVNRVL